LEPSAGERGPIGELSSILATGVLDPATFRAHVARHGVRKETWFRLQVLDLAFGFVQATVTDRHLTRESLADIRALTTFLEIPDGEFLEHRPAEIAALLGVQLERILEDLEISSDEELYQLDLQSVFGLGYDDYLALTRRALEQAHVDLSRQAGETGPSADEARRKLKALEPIYRLATAQRRSLGAMY
jgi:hypothetical protein